MSASFVLDPCLLAIPKADSFIEEVERYAADLASCSTAAKEKWIGVYLSDSTLDVLANECRMPSHSALRDLCRGVNITSVDSTTIAVLANAIISRAAPMSSLYGIRELLFDSLNISPEPLEETSEAIRQEFARVLGHVAIVDAVDPDRLVNHALASPTHRASVVRVTGTLVDIEPSNDNPLDCAPPMTVEMQVHPIRSFDEMLRRVDALALWADQRDMSLPIRLSIYQGAHSDGDPLEWRSCSGFRIGRAFRKTVRELGFYQQVKAEKLLRSCVDTTLHRNLAKVHDIRESQSGSSKQLRRGKDKAYRRDIDDEFHLHYWECDDGVPEFANVVVHNDFAIA